MGFGIARAQTYISPLGLHALKLKDAVPRCDSAPGEVRERKRYQ